MARRQGSARRGRLAPELSAAAGPGKAAPALTLVVHGLEQAQAAAAVGARRGLDLRFLSAPGAAAFWGVGFLAGLERQLGRTLVIDCGDDPGLVMAGLRAGCRSLLFTGSARTARKLESMAAQLGGRVVREIEPPVLALRPEEEPGRALLLYLSDRPS